MGIFSKEDLAKLDDRGPVRDSGASDWFRPTHNKDTGKTREYKIRLLPLSAEDPYPFEFFHMHYFYGENYLSGVCPSRALEEKDRKPCPACDLFFTLISTPEINESDTLKKTLRRVAPDQRAFANVYDYNVEGIRAWSIPYGARTKMDTTINQMKGFGVIVTDPEDGRDLMITMKALGRNSQMEGAPSANPDPTKLPVENWEEEMFDLTPKAHQRELTVAEVEEAILGQLGDHAEVIYGLYEKYTKAEAPTITTEDIGEEL
jgi:hypothetical protein